MATHASFLRSTGVDGTTIQFDGQGRLRNATNREQFSSNGNPSVFYVDGNVLTTGDGRTWDSAYKTLAQGLASAHSYMSTSANRAWAQRATVYVVGDAIEEDLTKFAEKTDIIGVGTTNQHPRTRITGTHVLESASTDTYHGCAWHNIEFYGQDGGIIVDIPVDQNGQMFFDCVFSAVAAATIGIRAVQSHDMNIVRCRFDPNTSGVEFSTAAIQINAGSVTNFLLQDCRITGAIGLDFNPAAATAVNCWCVDNIMRTSGIGIDSESGNAVSLICIGNRMVTTTDTSTYTNGFDFNEAQAVGNIVTGSGETDRTPIEEATAN